MNVFYNFFKFFFVSIGLAAKIIFFVPAAFSETVTMENSMNKSDFLTETNTIAEMERFKRSD